VFPILILFVPYTIILYYYTKVPLVSKYLYIDVLYICEKLRPFAKWMGEVPS